MNLRENFEASSFSLAGEIQNKQKTVSDISTLCLSACVDNKFHILFIAYDTQVVFQISENINFRPSFLTAWQKTCRVIIQVTLCWKINKNWASSCDDVF